jgi:hypothetical protein
MPSPRIHRRGEPERMRALTEGGAIYQVPLSAPPDRLWRSLFLEQEKYSLDFVPILVRFTYDPPTANFQSEEWQLKERVRLLDLWIESANRRAAAVAGAGGAGAPLEKPGQGDHGGASKR